MIRAYFDSSAIFKLTKEEPESQALIDFLDGATVEASTSVVSEIEVRRNLRKIRLDPEDALTGFFLLELDDEIRHAASMAAGTALRSLDAIHIATALAIGDRELQFITYDDRQAEAARAAGLTVIQPGR